MTTNPIMKMQLSAHSEHAVQIRCAAGLLNAELVVPEGATGLVIFAQGSGSSRFSPRNRMLADMMHRHHLATLLVDPLTQTEAIEEEFGGTLRFNIALLTSRLACAIRWAQNNEFTAHLGIGLFGSSTGSAAALRAAAGIAQIQAVVLRGCCMDLANRDVNQVFAPTLLILGENDHPAAEFKHQSFENLAGIRHLKRIPGASLPHPGSGALEQVAASASKWFAHYLPSQTPAGAFL